MENRLKSGGVDINQFELKRGEFGYFRRSRNALQGILAPYYAFVYEPKEGIIGKKIVEFEPALPPGAILDAVVQDQDAENQRKALQIADVKADEVKLTPLGK